MFCKPCLQTKQSKTKARITGSFNECNKQAISRFSLLFNGGVSELDIMLLFCDRCKQKQTMIKHAKPRSAETLEYSLESLASGGNGPSADKCKNGMVRTGVFRMTVQMLKFLHILSMQLMQLTPPCFKQTILAHTARIVVNKHRYV